MRTTVATAKTSRVCTSASMDITILPWQSMYPHGVKLTGKGIGDGKTGQVTLTEAEARKLAKELTGHFVWLDAQNAASEARYKAEEEARRNRPARRSRPKATNC